MPKRAPAQFGKWKSQQLSGTQRSQDPESLGTKSYGKTGKGATDSAMVGTGIGSQKRLSEVVTFYLSFERCMGF